MVGWTLFGVSFCLPVVGFVFHPPGGMTPRYGYEIAGGMLRAGIIGPLVVLIPGALMAMALPALGDTRLARSRWPGRFLLGVGLLALVFGVGSALAGGIPITVGGGPAYHRHLGFGYWAWALSLSCVGLSVWLRGRRRTAGAAGESTG